MVDEGAAGSAEWVIEAGAAARPEALRDAFAQPGQGAGTVVCILASWSTMHLAPPTSTLSVMKPPTNAALAVESTIQVVSASFRKGTSPR